jgi:hypothetical protein
MLTVSYQQLHIIQIPISQNFYETIVMFQSQK